MDGTAVLFVASGAVPIGSAGDFTTQEYQLLSQSHVLIPGVVLGWTPEKVNFNWSSGYVPPASSGGGGSGGSGPTYHWKTPGVSTASNLPSSGNVINDATLTLDTFSLYSWDGAQWNLLANFSPVSSGFSLPVDGGAPDTTYTLIVDGGAPDTTYTLIIDGGTP